MTQAQLIADIGDDVVLAAFLSALAFIVSYTAMAPWWRHQHGISLVVMDAGLVLALGPAVVHRLLGVGITYELWYGWYDCASIAAGAPIVDALGSCTCNSGTAHLAERVKAATGSTAAFANLTFQSADADPVTLSPTNAKTDEEFAILAYHQVGTLAGAAADWPPTDGGSNGLFVCELFEKMGWTTGHKAASGMTNVVSLLQGGSVMMGGPYLKAWMEPNAQGFIDGDGSVESLLVALSGGVAGGHETLIVAVERLVFDAVGNIDLAKSWVRVRNSWSRAFGISGDYRVHLSTLAMIGSHFDYKQAIVKAA